MQYKMQLQTSTGGLPWEYNFDMNSDKMAREYTRRIAIQFEHVPWFMSLILWGLHTSGAIPLSEYKLEPVEARERILP